MTSTLLRTAIPRTTGSFAGVSQLSRLALAALCIGAVGLAGDARAFHDPRTTAKKLGQILEVEGAGKFTFDYKALHFNGEMFTRAKANEKFLGFLNQQVWGRMGKANVEFAVAGEGFELARGSYDFGINMTKDDKFSVVFWKNEQEKVEIPLTVEHAAKEVKYLTVTLMATAADDTFVIEARCGTFVGTCDLKVPFLNPDHPEHEVKKDGPK